MSSGADSTGDATTIDSTTTLGTGTTTSDTTETTGEYPDDCEYVQGWFPRPFPQIGVFTPETIDWFEGRRCVIGDAAIEGALEDLQALSSLEEVHGWLFIGAAIVDYGDVDAPDGPLSLTGLESLQYAGGLGIHGTELVDLAGLEGLSAIGEQGLWIEAPQLSDVDELATLQSIDGALRVGTVREMGELTSLAGLSGVSSLGTSLGVGLSLRRTGLVTLADLEGLTSIDGVVDLGVNPALVDVSALAGVEEVDGLMIYANDALSTCAALELGWSMPGAPRKRIVGNLEDNCVIPGACAALDAVGDGACEASIRGVFWDGAMCHNVPSACTCAGMECMFAKAWDPDSYVLNHLHPDFDACELAFAGC